MRDHTKVIGRPSIADKGAILQLSQSLRSSSGFSRRGFLFLGALAGLIVVSSTSPSPGRSATLWNPVSVEAPARFTAGDTIPLVVTLDGSPSPITITSSPAGAVSYSGSVSSSQQTVYVTTAPNVTGNVTIFLATDSGSANTVSTTSYATEDADGDPGSGGSVGTDAKTDASGDDYGGQA